MKKRTKKTKSKITDWLIKYITILMGLRWNLASARWPRPIHNYWRYLLLDGKQFMIHIPWYPKYLNSINTFAFYPCIWHESCTNIKWENNRGENFIHNWFKKSLSWYTMLSSVFSSLLSRVLFLWGTMPWKSSAFLPYWFVSWWQSSSIR